MTFRIRKLTTIQGLQWLSCGFRFWGRRPLQATFPIAVFVLLGGLLSLVPVIGNILLLLLLPTVAASFLIQVHIFSTTSDRHNDAARRGSRKFAARLEQQLRQTRMVLFGAWSKPENIFPLALIGFVLVFLGVITYALYTMVGGQGVVSPLNFYELNAAQMLRVAVAHGLASLIWLLITALLFWTLPLFTIRDVPLSQALSLNISAMRANAEPLMVYLLILACGFLPAALVTLESRFAGYLLFWITGTALVCLFGFSAYCSFRLVFAEPPAQRASMASAK